MLFVVLFFSFLRVEAHQGKFAHNLEQHHISLDHERNRQPEFQYKTLNTLVGDGWKWEHLPEQPIGELHNLYKERKACSVGLQIELLNYDVQECMLCLFRGERDLSIFSTEGSPVDVKGDIQNPLSLAKYVNSVTGYVLGEKNSLVSGYLVAGNFYGTVRLYNALGMHFIIYYIEPLTNLSFYSSNPPEARRRRSPENDGDKEASVSVEITPPSKAVLEEEDAKNDELEENKPKTNENDDEIVPLDAKTQKESSSGEDNAILFEFIPHDDSPESSRSKRTAKGGETKKKEDKEPGEDHPHPEATVVFTQSDQMLNPKDDVVHETTLKHGVSKSDVFELRRNDSYICDVCVWLDAEFINKFSLGGVPHIAAAEVVDILSYTNWIFRALDFNGDAQPEKIGFQIKEIRVKGSSSNEKDEAQTEESKTTGNEEKSKVKENEEKPDENDKEEVETETPTEGLAEETRKKREHEDKKTNEIKSFVKKMKKNMKALSCCAKVAFVYENIAPAISATTLRGACSEHNDIVVSGKIHSHKIGKYDISRALFHALGHFFGASHDELSNPLCHDGQLYTFLNPFAMHPIQQMNVGSRPNSMRMSHCSKIDISVFLSSSGSNCLKPKPETYCGNGIIENDEECDCGTPWQCEFHNQCCGLRDSFMPCKFLSKIEGKTPKTCYRPLFW